MVTKEFPGFANELDWSIQVPIFFPLSILSILHILDLVAYLLAYQAAELYDLATAEGLSPKVIPLWTADYRLLTRTES